MNVGVVGNPEYDAIRGLLARLAIYAARSDMQVFVESSLEDVWPGSSLRFEPHDPSQPLDLLITFGGDGTLLRGARVLADCDVPILGINLGRVGFLNTTAAAKMEQALERIAHGDYEVQAHVTLTATIVRTDGTTVHAGDALNDVVVHKRGTARVVQLRVSIDGDEVGQYSADGIIVATPMGSTAYSLSAGGPIVVPDVDALVVTAICPHTLAVRPIVIPARSDISIQQAGTLADDILVSIDGQISTTLATGEVLLTRRGQMPKRLIRFGKERFFERVRNKLQWGDLSGRKTNTHAH